MEMLQRYASEFSTVEVPDTFSGIPPESLMKDWHEAVPAGFKFSLRIPQQVTHERRFADSDRLLQRFLERASLLEEKLGPLLMAIPVGFVPNEETRKTIAGFLKSLPTGFSWVLECRRADWLTDSFLEVMEGVNVALALIEGRWMRRNLMLKLAQSPTADFMYLRVMGKRPSGNEASDQLERKRALTTWSTIVGEMRAAVEYVAVYFSERFDSAACPHCVRDFGDLLGVMSYPPADRA
jgi:uncharacterized protein YecE (DUF72 family)